MGDASIFSWIPYRKHIKYIVCGENVAYYGGATVITYKGKFGAFTLGSFINGGRNLHADPDNALFQHEYGHYLQSQNSGLFIYLFTLFRASLMLQVRAITENL